MCSLGGKGNGRKKVFLQNEPIMSFRINKSNGFVWVCLAKKPLESQPRPLIGGCRWGRMEHRATGLCSLQGRQECLPYLNAYRYLFRNYRKDFVAPGICRGGRSSRRMFREPRGEASGGKIGIYYETKPTSLLESTDILRGRVKKHQKAHRNP